MIIRRHQEVYGNTIKMNNTTTTNNNNNSI